MFSINLLWLLWVVVLGWADWDQLFVSQGDPSIVEYVDVTTGQLVLYREGVQAEGAVPLLLHRMYTSAEEKEEAKKIQSNICDLGSGWGLLPHLQLCIDPIGKALFAYTREPSGAFVGYQWTLEKSKQVLFFKSLVSSGARYGLLSHDPSHYRSHGATLDLPLQHDREDVFFFLLYNSIPL